MIDIERICAAAGRAALDEWLAATGRELKVEAVDLLSHFDHGFV